MPELTLIAALDRAGAIGRGKALPWHLPDDFRRFKALTVGRPVLMGYRTAVSIGRALPDRDNLVLSRHREPPFPGQRPVRSVAEAVAAASAAGAAELMVAGGGKVYAATLPLADSLRLTLVDTVVDDPDAFFPPIDPAEWRETGRERHPADDRHAYAFDWVDYARRR
jgi:dihydrofolate reductase